MEKMAYLFPFKTPKVGRVEYQISNIKYQIIKNWPIILIILLAAFLRLYRISDYLTFLGDEGRDVLTAKGILEGQFVLLGPRASAGDFFTGPFYYYLIAPFLWAFRLDPVGPAIMVALIGIATVFLVYYVANSFFGKRAAIFASSLYAVSPLVIAHSRSSWNPNPMPFVSLLTLYLAFRSIQNPTFKKFLAVGILLGIALQLHYISVFLIIIVGVFLFAGNFYKSKSIQIAKILKNYLQIFLGFLISFSPFLFFELRHGFPNIKTILSFILGSISGASPYTGSMPFIEIVKEVFFRIFARLVTRFPPPEQLGNFPDQTILNWQIATLLVALASVFYIFRVQNKLFSILLSCWLLFGILLFGFYKKPILDHYLVFMFPLPFLLVGNFLSELYGSRFKLLKPASVIIFLVLLGFNLSGMPFRFEPNRQKEQVKTISQFVISKTDGKPFNFALLTPRNSDHAYRYYFEVLGNPDTRIENIANDPQRKTVTDQLLIVCEDPNCKPLGHPLFEISNFGRAEIVGEWNVLVVKVFKLVHYKGI